MERLIFELIVWLAKSLWELVVALFRLIVRGFRALQRAQSGGGAPREELVDGPSSLDSGEANGRSRVAELVKSIEDRSQALATQARRCAGEEGNGRLGAALYQLSPNLRDLSEKLRRGGEPEVAAVLAEAARLEMIVAALEVMIAQRRDRDLLLLLGDADALAAACYKPIVEYARGEGIPLTFEHAVTVLGASDLFAALYENPARMAAVVLPPDWPVQVAWWPALAHEVGHCFYRSVAAGGKRGSLDAELRVGFGLPGANMRLPAGTATASEADVKAALGSWLEELFADAFGVMMLGPAFIETMIWSFAGTAEEVVTCQPTEEARFDEHPPAHLRVVVACRLLAEMGYGTDARRLEKRWRKKCGGPQHFWFPTRNGKWLGVAEVPLLARAETVAKAFYSDTFTSLGNQPLRSIPGLDFGPREHQAALAVATALIERRPPATRDPRMLIAGAVLAWVGQPDQGDLILRGARAHIPAIEVSARRLRLRAEASDAEGDEAQAGSDVVREAMLLGVILRRPRLGVR